MPDKEKVIKWLDVCKTADRAVGLKEDYPCRECPYKDSPRCMRELVADALALLKEQESEIDEISDEYLDLGNEIAKMPKVVRCKDCKHGGCRTQNIDGSIFRVVCKKHSTKRNERWMDADWYCADGERQEVK